METLLASVDGYMVNKNNWRLYQRPRDGKWLFIAHGMDRVFAESEMPLFPPTYGRLAHEFFQHPELRQLYLKTLEQLLQKCHRPEFLEKRIDELSPRILALLRQTNPQEMQAFSKTADKLKERIAARRAFLARELAKPRP